MSGFTEEESDAWEKVRVAASACLGLTETDPLHPMEREEICHEFHHIQRWLASRPTMKKMYGR